MRRGVDYSDRHDAPRVAVLQRVLPRYRVSLFKALSNALDGSLRIFIGEDIKNSKVRSTNDFEGLDVVKLPTRHFVVRKRCLTNHFGLIAALKAFRPKVIVCEGESNILNYAKVLLYFRIFSPNTALVHWSLGGVPGEGAVQGLKRLLKLVLLSRFDSYIVYSSFGREALIRLGCDPKRITVAVNVSDTTTHLQAARRFGVNKAALRAELGLPNIFTAIYVGDFSKDKRVEVLLEVAARTTSESFNFLLIGDGQELETIREIIKERNLKNIFLPGRVSWEAIARYYLLSNVFILPGRGGMVISEAMAFGLPVLVHRADGTEFDLVQDNITGLRLKNGDVDEILLALEKFRTNPQMEIDFGWNGLNLVRYKFTIEHSSEAIKDACSKAIKLRKV
jgi:glycosyltransferase involved in cell wall biosynthesis